jgi:hypothetical protein
MNTPAFPGRETDDQPMDIEMFWRFCRELHVGFEGVGSTVSSQFTRIAYKLFVTI